MRMLNNCVALLWIVAGCLVVIACCADTNIDIDATPIDLPASHLPTVLHQHPNVIAHVCRNDAPCVQQTTAQLRQRAQQHVHQTTTSSPKPCWGYELGCLPADRFARPAHCTNDDEFGSGIDHDPNFQHTVAAALNADTFFEQADFGYVREQRRELQTLCEPHYLNDTSLECSAYLRFCRARNLHVDFRSIAGGRTGQFRYRMDVLGPGQIGGRCRLDRQRLAAHSDHMSALQSWAPELRHLAEMESLECDEWVDRPTYFLKIDATHNMYHHFCDLLNFYATLHVNATATHPAVFGTDVQLLVWETYAYRSPFAAAWTAFSRWPVRTLNDVRGRRVCYRNLVLPLLPRMIFGLYYNTPIVSRNAISSIPTN